MYKALPHKEIEWAYQKWCEGYTQQQTIRRAINERPRIRPNLKYEERENNA